MKNQENVDNGNNMQIGKKIREYSCGARGRRILDHDLYEIAEGFLKFAKEQGFSFSK